MSVWAPGVANAVTKLTPSSTNFYLVIGASVSVGVQPTPSAPRGQPTDRGYANDLVAIEAAKGITLQMTQLGCPGETIATMINGADNCYHMTHSQLLDAVAFLKSHYNQGGIVTIDLGFNDLMPCLSHTTVDTVCVNTQLSIIQYQLPQVLSTLKAAAGPNVTFVGVGHYNPFTAKALLSGQGRTFAAGSVDVMGKLNQTLRSIYSSFSIPMANVADSFADRFRTRAHVAGFGTVSANIAQACNLTWMCQPFPYGPNLHPNDAGYQVIARSIAAVLPRRGEMSR